MICEVVMIMAVKNVHLFWKCSPILKMLIRPKVFKAHHSWLLYSSFFVILDFLYFMFFTNFHKLKNKVNIPKNVHLNLNQIFFNHHLTAQWVTLSLTDSFNHWFLWQLFCNFVYIYRTGNITHFQKIHPNFKYPQPSFFGRKIYFKYLTNKRFSQRFPSRQK